MQGFGNRHQVRSNLVEEGLDGEKQGLENPHYFQMPGPWLSAMLTAISTAALQDAVVDPLVITKAETIA